MKETTVTNDPSLTQSARFARTLRVCMELERRLSQERTRGLEQQSFHNLPANGWTTIGNEVKYLESRAASAWKKFEKIVDVKAMDLRFRDLPSLRDGEKRRICEVVFRRFSSTDCPQTDEALATEIFRDVCAWVSGLQNSSGVQRNTHKHFAANRQGNR